MLTPAPKRDTLPSGPAELPAVTMDNLAGGAIREMFDVEMQRVLENVLDPNTTTAKRKITIVVEITPNDARNEAGVNLKVESKLAPSKGTGAVLFVGRRRGLAVATQYDPRQMQLAWDAESRPRIAGPTNDQAGKEAAPE